MTISIANILGSDLAIYHEEGIEIYDTLKKAFESKEQVLVSFVGLTRCSTQFLNASIGKLYLLEDPALVDKLLSYDYGDYSLMEAKVSEVRDNAIHSKEWGKS